MFDRTASMAHAMRITVADFLGSFLFLSLIATGDAMAETVNFDSFSPGALPADWVCGVTGSGGSRWTVEPAADAPSKPNVVKQSGIGDFPWCALKSASMTDGYVE